MNTYCTLHGTRSQFGEVCAECLQDVEIAKEMRAMGMQIVSGVGTASTVGGSPRVPLAQAIEMAMVKAVQNALDEGVSISNTEELLRRKALARKTVIDNQSGG